MGDRDQHRGSKCLQGCRTPGRGQGTQPGTRGALPANSQFHGSRINGPHRGSNSEEAGSPPLEPGSCLSPLAEPLAPCDPPWLPAIPPARLRQLLSGALDPSRALRRYRRRHWSCSTVPQWREKPLPKSLGPTWERAGGVRGSRRWG